VLLPVERDRTVGLAEVPALPGKSEMADRELGVSELGLDAVDRRRRGDRSCSAEREQCN
jgi:hypothetical protein